MATNYKVLGQSAPSATTNTTLYGCPLSTQTVISSLVVCNRGTTTGTVRVAVRPDGATLANQHYIVYDLSVNASETVALTLGLTVDANDIVTVYASTANFTFSAYGSEIV